jgi:hypothetical protein
VETVFGLLGYKVQNENFVDLSPTEQVPIIVSSDNGATFMDMITFMGDFDGQTGIGESEKIGITSCRALNNQFSGIQASMLSMRREL